METRNIGFLLAIVIAGTVLAGCTSPNEGTSHQPGNIITPTTTYGIEPSSPMTSAPVPCGMNSCQVTEECCNGFCIDPAQTTCCRGKPCQGSCCNVSGTEQCYDPEQQTCCENTLCQAGGCCAGSCYPSSQYFCVYVNGTGCYGLPGYVKCSWEDGAYQLVRTNVPFGEPDPSYLDIIIVPATDERSQISEYWIIPSLGGGASRPAYRVT